MAPSPRQVPRGRRVGDQDVMVGALLLAWHGAELAWLWWAAAGETGSGAFLPCPLLVGGQ